MSHSRGDEPADHDQRPSVIPADVAFLALNPGAAGPEPVAESGASRVLNSRFCVLMTPMPTLSLVEILGLSAEELAVAVADVRRLLRARERGQAAWAVLSTLAEHLEVLTSLGMTPYTDPPLEPTCACLALVQPPHGSPSEGVVVREATELADFLEVGQLAAFVFDMSDEDHAGFVEAMRKRYELHKQGRSYMSTYLAYLDGRLVGEAQATVTSVGVNLSGSSVVPSARGRGVYRALVMARWNEAVERGTPALTVQAGAMSQPILERLGFQPVGTQQLLCDRFD